MDQVMDAIEILKPDGRTEKVYRKKTQLLVPCAVP
jgi:hypothetical protein